MQCEPSHWNTCVEKRPNIDRINNRPIFATANQGVTLTRRVTGSTCCRSVQFMCREQTFIGSRLFLRRFSGVPVGVGLWQFCTSRVDLSLSIIHQRVINLHLLVSALR